jgi:hypothetical protein
VRRYSQTCEDLNPTVALLHRLMLQPLICKTVSVHQQTFSCQYVTPRLKQDYGTKPEVVPIKMVLALGSTFLLVDVQASTLSARGTSQASFDRGDTSSLKVAAWSRCYMNYSLQIRYMFPTYHEQELLST